VDQHVWDGRGNGKAGGSVQRMPGGGHLVGFGSLTMDDTTGLAIPVATELSADGEEIWNLRMPDEQWSYRSWRALGDPIEGGWTRDLGLTE
jgi:hypothetical protein